MSKIIILSCISIFYTLLYVFVMNPDIVIHPILALWNQRKQDWMVWPEQVRIMQVLLFFVLASILVLLLIFQFEKIKGFFIYIYFSSLIMSFLVPIFFSSIRGTSGVLHFPWYFPSIITLLLNLIFGPAMIFLITYLVLNRIKV